jgi:LPXTG-motif cell wall-anchored protein
MRIRCNRFLLTSAALIGFTMTTALADEWDKEIVFQFNEPVQVPGKVLEPGKYIFRLADSSSDRNIVQIFSVNDKGRWDFVKTILAVPDYRETIPDKPVVSFEERHLGDPEAIKSWFYPGGHTGWHFVYPKSERLEVAAAIPAPPPPAPAPAAEPEPAAPAVEPSAEQPQVVTEEQTVIAQVEPTPAPAEDNQASADRELPETAGQSAWLPLAGFSILATGLIAVFVSRRKIQDEMSQ